MTRGNRAKAPGFRSLPGVHHARTGNVRRIRRVSSHLTAAVGEQRGVGPRGETRKSRRVRRRGGGPTRRRSRGRIPGRGRGRRSLPDGVTTRRPRPWSRNARRRRRFNRFSSLRGARKRRRLAGAPCARAATAPPSRRPTRRLPPSRLRERPSRLGDESSSGSSRLSAADTARRARYGR